jgi:uncharacterized GH25 family protein
MKKILFGLIAVTLLCSHDLFLKLDHYFLEARAPAVIQLFNGSFEVSENVIDRSRMIDASLVNNGNRTQIDKKQWFERDQTTFLNFETGASGTYILGVSTAARTIEMEAVRFNNYLEHDGVDDMLLSRKQNNQLDQNANEKYSKHVKTIFQVGDTTSNDWNTVLGYPIEFVPLENPYELHPGHSLNVQLLSDGKPLANHTVLLGTAAHKEHKNSKHTHDDGTTHSHEDQESLTSGHSYDEQKALKASNHTHDDGTTHSHEDQDSLTSGHSYDEQKELKASKHIHDAGTTHSHEDQDSSTPGQSYDEQKELKASKHTHDAGTTHSHEDQDSSTPGHSYDEQKELKASNHTQDAGTTHSHEDQDSSPSGHSYDEQKELKASNHTQDDRTTHSHEDQESLTSGHSYDEQKALKASKHTHDAGTTHSHEDQDSSTSGHSYDEQKELKASKHTHDAGTTHSHEDQDSSTPGHSYEGQQQLRTDGKGIVQFNLSHEGIYHLRSIQMIESREEDITHESNWATLTFAVGSGHDHVHDHDDDHTADAHDHEEDVFPSYIFWIGSFAVLIGLFLYFNRKK